MKNLLFIALLAVHPFSTAQVAEECRGIWSSAGKQPRVGDAYTADAIASPDKQSSLTVSEDSVQFTRGNGKPVALDVPANPALMEIVWSPDSNGFAFNISDASNDGPWRTYVYRLVAEHDEPQKLPLDPELNKSMGALRRCDANAPVNLASVVWLSGGKELLIVAETPILEACREKRGELAAFKLSAHSGKIVERLAPAALAEMGLSAFGCRVQVK